MATTQDRRFRARTSYVIAAAVLGTVLARLPLLGLPAWPDEAGFLMVGGGWNLGGSSTDRAVYGSYWVDRPPVLIGLYGFADRLGGLEALRLVGALAAAVTVVCVGVDRTLGRRSSCGAVGGRVRGSAPVHPVPLVVHG